MKAFKSGLACLEGSLGVDGEFTIMAFAEGYMDDNHAFVLTESGGMMMFGVSLDYSQNFLAGPVPLIFEIGFSGDLEAQLNLFLNNKVKEFTPRITVDSEVALKLGIGVGLANVASFSGGGKGKLLDSAHFNEGKLEYYKLDGALDWYLKLKVIVASFEWGDTFARRTFYEYPDPGSPVMMLGLDDEQVDGSSGKPDFYDASQYTVDNLSYLKYGSSFMGGGTSTFSGRSLNNNAPFVSNAYEGADPQTAFFSDGTRLIVWIGYNNSHSGANALNLYYSYYDGAWSQPQVVEDDGTTDAYPDLKVINDTAYLVWQDASGSIGNDATLDNIANLMEISGAVFDKENESFACSSITSDSGALNMQPKLCGDNSAVYVVWHRNSENDWFGQNSSNSLLCSRFSGDSWGGSSVLYSGLNPLMGFDVSCSGGSCIVAYAMDGDGDLNTTEDLEVYKNGVALTGNDWLDSGVTFCGTDLYWYSGGKLLKNGNDTMPEGVFIGSDRFQIINENGVHAVVYAEEDGLASVLKVAYYDAATSGWGSPIDLYNAGTSISAFSASATVDGEISVLIQSQDVVGEFDGTNPYGTVNLVWYNAPMGCDIQLDDVRYYNENYILGNDMPVYLTVTNTGELAVQKLRMDLIDEEGNVVLTKIIGQTLLSGATKEIEFVYHVISVESGEKLTINVYPVDMEDIFLEDNTGELMLGWEDISVEDIRTGVTEAGKIVIHANIVNRGYQPQNNVTVKLLEMSPSGNVVDIIILESIDAQSRASVSFTLGDMVSKVYYVFIEHKEADQNYANDNDFVNISADIDPDDIYGENAILIHETELGENSIVYVDGEEQKLKKFDEYYYLNLHHESGMTMTAHNYHVEDSGDVHSQYPISMKAWTLSNEDGIYSATRVEELDDILQYSGASIRVIGKKGIRMITAIDQADKKALTGEGLAGYTLKEYGTVIAWASQINEYKPLVLGKSYVKSNYAYKQGVADPIFAYEDDKMQYTNVLINFSDAQCSKDIAMRPYMILADSEGNELTLYGGIVERSIGYIALQNKDTFTKGTEAYNYVWGIIKSVYGDVEE